MRREVSDGAMAVLKMVLFLLAWMACALVIYLLSGCTFAKSGQGDILITRADLGVVGSSIDSNAAGGLAAAIGNVSAERAVRKDEGERAGVIQVGAIRMEGTVDQSTGISEDWWGLRSIVRHIIAGKLGERLFDSIDHGVSEKEATAQLKDSNATTEAVTATEAAAKVEIKTD